jgi:hypothetical protein
MTSLTELQKAWIPPEPILLACPLTSHPSLQLPTLLLTLEGRRPNSPPLVRSSILPAVCQQQ